MIQKIEKIVSIGKFRNYQAAGIVTFNKLTLLYADNGSGKTTLTAILRSLTQNNPELIRKRISTNATVPQAAQIIQRNSGTDTYHTFGRSGWSNSFPDIEIFDTHFIHENVYSGFDFNDDQRKQLHQFVIGAQGVTLHQQIEQNKTDKTASRQTQSSLEQQLIQLVANDLTTSRMTEFISIIPAQAANIDQLITAAETALSNANSNAVIQSLHSLVPLSTITTNINFSSIIADLQATTETLQNDVLKTLFQSHCTDLTAHSVQGPENWLKTGLGYIKAKQGAGEVDNLQCPFCKQPINDQFDILKAYSLRFNDQFNALVQRLQNHLMAVQRFNLEAALQGLNNVNVGNVARISSWSSHLPATTQAPVYNIFTEEKVIKEKYEACVAALQQKIQNPSAAISATSITEFQTLITDSNDKIAAYNQNINTYNTAISSFRAGIQTVIQAQAEVNRLKRIKKRFETAIVAICTQLTTEKQSLRNLEAAYTRLVGQQETAASTFFATYKGRINHYLQTVFKTPFQIADVTHVAPQGKATQSKITYKLTIDGNDISFDPSQPNSARECLSEGDKSTIALALFLSKLDIDPGTSNKIVVFDDPLSSFDSNRRMYTVYLLKDLLPKVKQIVVLSHSEHFLHEISKIVSPADKITLRVTEDFVAKASKIEPLSLEALVENDYFKHVTELEQFLRNSDISKKDTVLSWMRNVLEAHIRFKFYRQINAALPNSNNRTFGKLIDVLANGVVFRNNTNRVVILNKLRLINGVSCKVHHGEPAPDYAALGSNPNTMTVSELAGLVSDTLHLIDNDL